MQRDVIERSIILSAQPGDDYGIERDLRGDYRKRNRIKKSVLSKERVLINFFFSQFCSSTSSSSKHRTRPELPDVIPTVCNTYEVSGLPYEG